MSKFSIRLPSKNYVGRDASAVERDLLQFVRARRADDVNAFYEGDFAKILIEMLAFISDGLSYQVDRTGEEAFLVTCRERDSALRHAAAVGYPVRTVTPASAVLVPESFASIPSNGTASVDKNEFQQITFTPSGSPGGNFRLVYNGESSLVMAYPADATVSGITTALESIAQIGAGNVAVTNPSANTFVVEFINAHKATDMLAVTVDASLLTNCSAGSSIVQNGEKNSYVVAFNKGDKYSAGGLTWEVAADFIVDGATVTAANYQTLYAVPVVQGDTFDDSFISTGRAFQTFIMSRENVVRDSIELRVSDPNGTAWKAVDAIGLAGADEEAYEVRFDGKGRATFKFGDGVTGKIPPLDSVIYIGARSSSGTNGNIGVRGVRVQLRGVADVNGTPTTLTVPATNISPANGGADAESLDELRRNIPRWVRTVDKAITKEDYDTQAELFDSAVGAVARAAAYLASGSIMQQQGGDAITPANPLTVAAGTLITLGTRTFRLAKTIVIEEEDPVLFLNPNVVNVYLWSMGDAAFEPSSDTIMAACRAYLQARSVVTTTIFVRAGRLKTINVNLGDVFYTGDLDTEKLSLAISDAVRAFFVGETIRPGEAFRLSELYAAVASVPGVAHFVVQSPVGDVEVGKDEIAVLGTLDFDLSPVVPPLDADPSRAAFGDELFT